MDALQLGPLPAFDRASAVHSISGSAPIRDSEAVTDSDAFGINTRLRQREAALVRRHL